MHVLKGKKVHELELLFMVLFLSIAKCSLLPLLGIVDLSRE